MQFAATESPLKIMKNAFYITFNPIQDGVQKAPSLTSFSPVTSTNVGISPKNFLTFSFNLFVILV